MDTALPDGQITSVPATLTGDLKQKLKALQPSSDKLIRRITVVELLLEGKKQEEDELTLGQVGLSLATWFEGPQAHGC